MGVLDGDGNPVERATIPAGHDLFLCGPGRLERHVSRDGDERVHLWFNVVDTFEDRVSELNGRELLALDQGGSVSKSQVMELAHRRLRSRGGGVRRFEHT